MVSGEVSGGVSGVSGEVSGEVSGVVSGGVSGGASGEVSGGVSAREKTNPNDQIKIRGNQVKPSELTLITGLVIALGVDHIGVQAFGALLIFLASAVMPMEKS